MPRTLLRLRSLILLAAVVLAGGVAAACSDAPTNPARPDLRPVRSIIVKDTTRAYTTNSDGSGDEQPADTTHLCDGPSMGSGVGDC